MYCYLINRILEILNRTTKNDFANEKYEVVSCRGLIYASGINISFRGDNRISIQTSPEICGEAICEIVIFSKERPGRFVRSNEEIVQKVLPSYYSTKPEEVRFRACDFEDISTFFNKYLKYVTA